MIIQYALIKNGIVADRTFTEDPSFIDAIRPLWDHIEPLDTEQEQGVGIGWTWTGYGFLPPNAPAPDMRPEIEITGIVSADPNQPITADRLDNGLWDVTCREGEIINVSASLMSNGSIVPITANFRMPMAARSGRTLVLDAVMVNGKITASAYFAESEIWSVTESAINDALPIDEQMRFDGLSIQVMQIIPEAQ